jgi:hypothetical protein
MNALDGNTPNRFLGSAVKLWLIPLVAAGSLGGFLILSEMVYKTGFPLDDAWIHQTYARNLALRGEWAFLPGQPSAGSTSPLWTGLLAPGFWLGFSPFGWTFLLGWLILSGVGLAGARISLRLLPMHPGVSLATGVFLTLEWHLVWAAASGMETLLFSLIALITFFGLFEEKPGWIVLGLLVGISIWLRPDGVTLAAPVIVAAILKEMTWRSRFQAVLWFAAGFFICTTPYLLFNRSLSGAWWPNTFFAKQAEYAIHRQAPLIQRYFDQFVLLLVGAGVLLLPGFISYLLLSVRRRAWIPLAFAAWSMGLLLLYALRLPVTYQHGRYIIPAMPVYFVLGLAGLASFVKPQESKSWKRLVGRAWVISLVIILVSFWVIGANAYAKDVAVIESEMVTTARWIAEHTESEALIAAHDIGALGYFGERKIIDLAGLVSPEVIPFIRDESRLSEYLDDKGVDYLMTFPGWYPRLVSFGMLVFDSGEVFSPEQGGENMHVYRWGPSQP